MKFVRVRGRFRLGLLILLVLACGSVVWAGDGETRLPCTAADRPKSFIAYAQLPFETLNGVFIVTPAPAVSRVNAWPIAISAERITSRTGCGSQ